MYSAQETALLTKEFWTSFGRYLSPILSAEGERINWINYKTKQKDIRFIMTVDSKAAKIAVSLSHKDPELQQSHFTTFVQLKTIFHQFTGEAWTWRAGITNVPGMDTSEVYSELHGINILNKSDWPAIISFLKPRIIALDKFWCEYKYAFER